MLAIITGNKTGSVYISSILGFATVYPENRVNGHSKGFTSTLCFL